MMHGLEDSSDAWIMNGPDKSPAFVAASQGYDVWVGNARGNFYSRDHVSMDPDNDEEYWNFSFVEMGKFDVPAIIRYIRSTLDMADTEKMIYIGHSQGNTDIFYGMIKLPQFYKDNIKGIVSFSPLVRLSEVNKMAELPGSLLYVLTGTSYFSGFFNLQTYMRWFNVYACQLFRDACMMVTAFTATSEAAPLDYDRVRTFYGHYPATSSFKCWKHWGQNFLLGKWQEYDYGSSEKNIEVYGQSTPPQLEVQ